MNYKDVVDRIKQICEDHYMIKDYAYGVISDIPVANESSEQPDYPYVFINPNGITRSGAATTYSFNLIAMELEGDDALKIQSECIQYLEDIVGELYFQYKDVINLTYNIQVFKERFRDNVAGATAILEITEANPINYCETPIA